MIQTNSTLHANYHKTRCSSGFKAAGGRENSANAGAQARRVDGISTVRVKWVWVLSLVLCWLRKAWGGGDSPGRWGSDAALPSPFRAEEHQDVKTKTPSNMVVQKNGGPGGVNPPTIGFSGLSGLLPGRSR